MNRLLAVPAVLVVAVLLYFIRPQVNDQTDPAPTPAAAPSATVDVPQKVLDVLDYVDKHGEPMQGYEGGRNFGNFEKLLPQSDDKGRRIKYREWDVNPLRPGVNRGADRMVTGSDGAAYYTSDHYKTFTRIRPPGTTP